MNRSVYAYGAVAMVVAGVAGYGLLPGKYAYEAGSVLVDDTVAQTEVASLKGVVASSSDEVVERAPSDAQELGYHPPYLQVPKPLKAIYMSQCVVGTPWFRDELVQLIEETELNAVVIDVKDYSGGLGYPFENPELSPYVSDECGAWDMPDFLQTLKAKNIYTIARITVFQDPNYARRHPELAVQSVARPGEPWRDDKGLNFIDVSAKPFWDYMVTLSREVHKLGFDELNFDYVRFPSDGPMADAHFSHSVGMSKAEALEKFFAHLHSELTNPQAYPRGITPPVMSADLFGFTTSNTDDLSIGQVLERTLPYFDYIAPMVYPSHYPNGSFGYGNPNHYPYEIIHRAMGDGVRRTKAERTVVETMNNEPIYEEVTVPSTGSSTAVTTERRFTGFYTKPVYDIQKLRPWLQDFDYGGNYDVKEVRAQIQATYDVGLTSWMLWAPSNRYTKEALEPYYSSRDETPLTTDETLDEE